MIYFFVHLQKKSGMYRSVLIFAVFLLSVLVLPSCRKDDKSAVTGDVMTFTGHISDSGAKTEVNGLEMTWSTDDTVLINKKEFPSTLTTDKKTATFTGEAGEPPYEAYYPTSLYQNSKYVLPEIQYYNGDNLSKVNPMYACSETNDLWFYNICAMMKLVVSGQGTIKTISVSAKKLSDGTPALLSGEFTVEGNASDGYYAEISPTTGSPSLTLNCGADGVKISTDPQAPTVFYIAMPKGEYSNLVFTFKGYPTDSVWTSSPVTKILEAGKMHFREMAGVNVLKPEKLSGVFSVGNGKYVQFSRGNLQYVKSTKMWVFANNQYDVVERYGQNVGEDYANADAQGLFGWGDVTPLRTVVDDDTINNPYTWPASGDPWGAKIVDGNNWRTLTPAEWKHLIFERGGETKVRYARAVVKNSEDIVISEGIVIVPDGWNTETYTLYHTNERSSAYDFNAISLNDWVNILEPAGCVFIPVTWCRVGIEVWQIHSGYYWTSLPDGGARARCFYFTKDTTSIETGWAQRYRGHAVRLVCDVE